MVQVVMGLGPTVRVRIRDHLVASHMQTNGFWFLSPLTTVYKMLEKAPRPKRQVLKTKGFFLFRTGLVITSRTRPVSAEIIQRFIADTAAIYCSEWTRTFLVNTQAGNHLLWGLKIRFFVCLSLCSQIHLHVFRLQKSQYPEFHVLWTGWRASQGWARDTSTARSTYTRCKWRLKTLVIPNW
jgi:hypothetical protein